MNFWKEVVVLLDWVSDKTKQKEGKIVFEQIEKHLPELIEKVDDKQLEKFKFIATDLSDADVICLRAYLKSMLNFYTIDGPCTGFEEQYVDHWHGVYGSYFEALNQVHAER